MADVNPHLELEEILALIRAANREGYDDGWAAGAELASNSECDDCHELGWRGWLILLTICPFIGLLVAAGLLFIVGSGGL